MLWYNYPVRKLWESDVLLPNDLDEEQLRIVNEKMQHMIKQIRISLTPVYESVENMKDIINKSFNDEFITKIETLKEQMYNFTKMVAEIDFQKLNENQKRLAQRMIEQGWYYSGLLPINVEYLLELDNKSFNREIYNFYEDEYEAMCSNIIQNFGDRKHILEKCFTAHNNSDYELCIPAMLAQADGISNELFGKYLFSKEKNIPVTKNQIKVEFDLDSSYDIAFYVQLSITGQLNKNCSEPKYFNRHMVLHGKDLKYARKSNSLRCIAMLNFLAEIKEEHEDKN